MSIRDLAWDVAALVAAVGIGIGYGYVRGDSHGIASMNTKVLAAQQAQASAERESTLSKEALGQVQAQLAKQRQDMQAASARAAQAIKDRDALARKLAIATRQRIDNDQKILHEKDCAPLDRLPVCPQLARRLFGQPAEAGSAGAPGH